MNLYQVWDKNYEWSCFAFDFSRNRAKASVAKVLDDDYINMRCKTLKRGITEIQVPTVVDSECDKAYEVVLLCGYKYYSEEELAEVIEQWAKKDEEFFNKAHPTEKGGGEG